MDKQEIFDTVVKGIREQGKPSVDPECNTRCLYRGPDGCKCAFGLLITDEEYDPQMENKLAHNVIADFGLDRFIEHMSLINELQSAHDDAAGDTSDPAEFVKEFLWYATRVADRFELNTEVCK